MKTVTLEELNELTGLAATWDEEIACEAENPGEGMTAKEVRAALDSYRELFANHEVRYCEESGYLVVNEKCFEVGTEGPLGV